MVDCENAAGSGGGVAQKAGHRKTAFAAFTPDIDRGSRLPERNEKRTD